VAYPATSQARGVLRHFRKEDGLPGFGHHRCHQRLVQRFEVIEQGMQGARPVARRKISPCPLVETPTGLGDGTTHFDEWCRRKLGSERLVSRILDGQDLVALHPPPRDERTALGEDLSLSHARAPRPLCRAWFYCFRVRCIRQATGRTLAMASKGRGQQ
jgi:hypothetical protein